MHFRGFFPPSVTIPTQKPKKTLSKSNHLTLGAIHTHRPKNFTSICNFLSDLADKQADGPGNVSSFIGDGKDNKCKQIIAAAAAAVKSTLLTRGMT